MKRRLAERTTKPLFYGIGIASLLIVASLIIISFKDHIKIKNEHLINDLYYGSFLVIFFCVLAIFFISTKFFQPKQVLTHDDDFIYIHQNSHKENKIKITDIKKVRLERIGKKSKKTSGYIIIKEKRQFKVTRIKNVKEVFNRIEDLRKDVDLHLKEMKKEEGNNHEV